MIRRWGRIVYLVSRVSPGRGPQGDPRTTLPTPRWEPAYGAAVPVPRWPFWTTDG
jgi:hypothetical protein